MSQLPPLLATKRTPPPTRAGLVPRPRLIERLGAGMLRKLILLSAPAGFGKTTLLAAWLASLAAGSGAPCPELVAANAVTFPSTGSGNVSPVDTHT